jgi:hypothetical protein
MIPFTMDANNHVSYSAKADGVFLSCSYFLTISKEENPSWEAKIPQFFKKFPAFYGTRKEASYLHYFRVVNEILRFVYLNICGVNMLSEQNEVFLNQTCSHLYTAQFTAEARNCSIQRFCTTDDCNTFRSNEENITALTLQFTVPFLASSHSRWRRLILSSLSVCPHIPTRLQLDRFPWNSYKNLSWN